MQKSRITFCYSVFVASDLGASGLDKGSSLLTVSVETLPCINKERLCRADKSAKLKQVIKNTVDKTVVLRVKNALVLVPKTDSMLDKFSTNPPPLPA